MRGIIWERYCGVLPLRVKPARLWTLGREHEKFPGCPSAPRPHPDSLPQLVLRSTWPHSLLFSYPIIPFSLLAAQNLLTPLSTPTLSTSFFSAIFLLNYYYKFENRGNIACSDNIWFSKNLPILLWWYFWTFQNIRKLQFTPIFRVDSVQNVAIIAIFFIGISTL